MDENERKVPEPLPAARELVAYIEALPIEGFLKAELKRLARKLAQLDELTRCLRQEYFKQEVCNAILNSNVDLRHPDRRSDWLALWVSDIARFKKINDNLGHNVGDLVLKRMGRILRSSIRQRQGVDIAGRMGGDEFAALLTHVTNVQGAYDATVRFKQRVDGRKWQAVNPDLKGPLLPKPDIGLVCLRVSSVDRISDIDEIKDVARKWYALTDEMMYRAKRHDGQIFFRCVEYDPETHELKETRDLFGLSLEISDRRHHSPE